eukprot:TRINITY_DN5674_c0_g1_i4.p3 TRINITY_DN5674_c0_g1~~TRINITY_DN5674_c0_g1_i4.p3  ORF type:complete len:190 (-),score=20.93 TRINITY_DN5674_c0_g1_i4:274-843(-)
MCSDTYLFATPNDFHFADFFFHGKHEIYFKNLSITSMQIMEEYGLRVFRFCDKIAHLMPDVLMTQYLFFAKPEGMLTKANVPPSEEQEKDNIKFIKEASGFEFKLRNTEIGDTMMEQAQFALALLLVLIKLLECLMGLIFKQQNSLQKMLFNQNFGILILNQSLKFVKKLILIYLIVNQWEQYKCISQT